MRRLPIFVALAVLLSAAAVAVRVTAREHEHLPRGWFRIPSGTVYLSDGSGGLCGYPSWEQFVGAGGAHGTWTQLEKFPVWHEDLGVCPVQKDRADWLTPGLLNIAGPTLLWLDGRGSACDTRIPTARVHVSNLLKARWTALPNGVENAGPCKARQLPPDDYRVGQKYFALNAEGHACRRFDHLFTATTIDALPADTVFDGVCEGATIEPGWYITENGTMYRVDQGNVACAHTSRGQFFEAGGRDSEAKPIDALPEFVTLRGSCADAPVYDDGWYLLEPRQQPVHVARGVMCGGSWKQFFANGGQVHKLVRSNDDRRIFGLRTCQLPDITKSAEPGWLPAGWFRIPTGTVYLSDGRGHVCGYASWPQYARSPAGGDKTAWVEINALPEGLVDDGVCPEIEIKTL